MLIWFEDYIEIECNIQLVIQSFENYGKHFVGVIKLLPGLTSVELFEEGSDYIYIKTNEGLMKRTNISKKIDNEKVVVEFDEEYNTGPMINVRTHYFIEFVLTNNIVKLHVLLSEVKTTGFLGFFYRKFGKSSTGKALLNSYKDYFEKKEDKI